MATDKLRIAIPIFVFQKTGGMRVLTMLANEWARGGAQVNIIVSDSSEPYFPVNSSVKITKLGVRHRILRVRALEKYIFKHFNDYDVIIANQNATTFPVYRATRRKKDYTKNYYYIQAYEADFYVEKGLKSRIKRMLAKKSYSLPLTKIVNADIYKDYKLVHAEKVVYPGIDLYNYYSKDPLFFNDTIKIGTIGRVEEWKGTSDVCKAMEILKSEGIRFEFYIAFNDTETITHHFVKPDGDSNLAQFYRDMDIVVAACKGQHGAIHYPIIESMAVGTSIICTDYYPSNDNNAYKVADSSPDQIAKAVKDIIADKEKAIEKRQQALKDIQQFSWPVVAQKFLEYLEEVKHNDNAKQPETAV